MAFLPKRISPLLVLSCFFTLFNLQGTRLFASFLRPQRTLISYHIQNRLSRGFLKFFQTFFNRLFFALAWNFDILPRFVPLVKWFFQLFSEVFSTACLALSRGTFISYQIQNRLSSGFFKSFRFFSPLNSSGLFPGEDRGVSYHLPMGLSRVFLPFFVSVLLQSLQPQDVVVLSPIEPL